MSIRLLFSAPSGHCQTAVKTPSPGNPVSNPTPSACRHAVLLAMILLAGCTVTGQTDQQQIPVQLGPRPLLLVDTMKESPLKKQLLSCRNQSFYRSELSIGHRGAPLRFPEHTRESYIAAAKMGAGALECDVTFTRDKELVCRHSQKDLHTTTNILAIPALAAKCTEPPDYRSETPFKEVECRTSDITLQEFLSLEGRISTAAPGARTLQEYLGAPAGFPADLQQSRGTVLSHRQSIALFRELGVKMIPELKRPVVPMPYQGYSQQHFAQQLIDEYRELGISPRDVHPQSFHLDDIEYWLSREPGFGSQAIFLDGRFRDKSFDHRTPDSWAPGMAELKRRGLGIIAPPLWMLVTVENGRIVPSEYARAARRAGLDIITWTLERSGPLNNGGGWYYQTISELIDNDGAVFELLDVLVREVGVRGVFSDWPATVTYYAGCRH